jgi:uncharacterized protein YqgC (DUF456 family)
MDLILITLGFLFCLIGIIGSFLPIIPGPVTAWLGILLLNLTSVVEFNLNFILITLTVAVSVGILDYLIPILGVKKIRGNKIWTNWDNSWTYCGFSYSWTYWNYYWSLLRCFTWRND